MIDIVVGVMVGNKEIFGVFREDGLKLYSYVMMGEKLEVLEGVKVVMVFGWMVFQIDGGGVVMMKLVDLVELGWFKLLLEIEGVGKGLGVIGVGLEKLRGGVSGIKLVVFLQVCYFEVCEIGDG